MPDPKVTTSRTASAMDLLRLPEGVTNRDVINRFYKLAKRLQGDRGTTGDKDLDAQIARIDPTRWDSARAVNDRAYLLAKELLGQNLDDLTDNRGGTFQPKENSWLGLKLKSPLVKPRVETDTARNVAPPLPAPSPVTPALVTSLPAQVVPRVSPTERFRIGLEAGHSPECGASYTVKGPSGSREYCEAEINRDLVDRAARKLEEWGASVTKIHNLPGKDREAVRANLAGEFDFHVAVHLDTNGRKGTTMSRILSASPPKGLRGTKVITRTANPHDDEAASCILERVLQFNEKYDLGGALGRGARGKGIITFDENERRGDKLTRGAPSTIPALVVETNVLPEYIDKLLVLTQKYGPEHAERMRDELAEALALGIMDYRAALVARANARQAPAASPVADDNTGLPAIDNR